MRVDVELLNTVFSVLIILFFFLFLSPHTAKGSEKNFFHDKRSVLVFGPQDREIVGE